MGVGCWGGARREARREGEKKIERERETKDIQDVNISLILKNVEMWRFALKFISAVRRLEQFIHVMLLLCC